MDQAAFAVSLAKMLGLAYLPTPPEAAALLAQRGIVPPGGWILERAISPGWLADLARSLLIASSAGLILHAPGEAFGILEELAAEVGVALVPVEPPPPSLPLVFEAPAQLVILESVIVPPFRFHHSRFFSHRFHGHRHAHRRPATLSHQQPGDHGSGRFHRLGNGFHQTVLGFLGNGFHQTVLGFHGLGNPQFPARGGRR